MAIRARFRNDGSTHEPLLSSSSTFCSSRGSPGHRNHHSTTQGLSNRMRHVTWGDDSLCACFGRGTRRQRCDSRQNGSSPANDPAYIRLFDRRLFVRTGVSGPAALKLSAFGARILNEGGYKGKLFVNWMAGNNPSKVKCFIRDGEATRPWHMTNSSARISLVAGIASGSICGWSRSLSVVTRYHVCQQFQRQ